MVIEEEVGHADSKIYDFSLNFGCLSGWCSHLAFWSFRACPGILALYILYKELPPNYRQSFDVFSKGKMRAFASKAKLFSKRKLASIRVTIKKIQKFLPKIVKKLKFDANYMV